MRRILISLTLFALFTVHLVLPTSAQTNCPDTLPSRLVIGAEGRVLQGSANNLRDQASRTATLIGQIPAEGVFTVLEGPVCADGFTWWRVDYDGLVGWTVEAIGENYAIESLAPTVTEIDFEGVTFTLTGDIATNADGSIEEEQIGAVPFPVPSHIRFDFGEVMASLSVYPAAHFSALHDNALTTLAELLEDHPANPEIPEGFSVQPGNRLFIRLRKMSVIILSA
jgi:hypothetical protein